MSRPDLLVLDEPTSGLDPMVRQEFHDLLREHAAEAAPSCSSGDLQLHRQTSAPSVGRRA